MGHVTQLDLHDLPIGEQSFADDPDPQMITAREKHPWLARSEFGFVVTEFDAVNELLVMDDRLKTPCEHVIEIMGADGTNWARFQRENLMARDGEDHQRIRRVVKTAFLPKAVKTYHEPIRRVVSDLLDEWAPRGRFDFEAFASRFPVAVMFGLLGIPRERIEHVKQWLEMLGQSFSLNREIFPQINDAFENLWKFASDLVAERKASATLGEPNVIDQLIEAEAEGVLRQVEVLDLILFMFAAGYDTSKNQLGQIMNVLIDQSEMWERCARDRSFCDDVTDEALRHSGVSCGYRDVVSGFEYRGVTLPAGTMLVFPYSIVCRYSGPFENPMEFIPGRPNARQYTVFSRGRHLCLGQFLARAQIAEGLHLIAQRLKNPRRDGEIVWRLFPGVWGPQRFPVAFDPVPGPRTAARGASQRQLESTS